jgi:hypothetical protein
MDWLPAATRVPHGSNLAWAETTNPKGVLHTTESSGRASYNSWTIPPHAEVLPIPGKGIDVHQFIPFTRASFALRHTQSQPTNTDYAMQFELVGTCDPSGPRGAFYWPKADDAVLLDLYRKVIHPLSAGLGIPEHALTFRPYPASYGANGVRLDNAQWDVYTGWLGHQNVPQQDHGDPGAFPWSRMMTLAGGQPKPPGPTPLTVDGILGDLTVRRLQGYVNAHGANPKAAVDGKLGPATWKAIQQWTGHAPATGVADRTTVRDLQTKIGVARGGILDAATIKALQRFLNAHA